MKIIQHRFNDPRQPLLSHYVEIDAQVNDKGEWVAKHDPDEKITHHIEYFLHLPIKGFFVNIKQALSISRLEQISCCFGEKLIGLFDVPYPSVYYAFAYHIPIYIRASIYEQPSTIFNKLWIDPMMISGIVGYEKLISENDLPSNRFIIAAPSLFGGSHQNDVYVADWLVNSTYRRRIDGYVTKYPVEVKEVCEGLVELE